MNRSKIIVVLPGFAMMMAVVLSSCATKKSGPEAASSLVLSVDQSRQALQTAKEQIQVTIDAANGMGRAEVASLNADLHISPPPPSACA